MRARRMEQSDIQLINSPGGQPEHVLVTFWGINNTTMWVCSCGGSSDDWLLYLQSEKEAEHINTQEMMSLTIGDILDLIAEPDMLGPDAGSRRAWRLRPGIDLNAPVHVFGGVNEQSDLMLLLSEEDNSLNILEA